MDAARYAFRLDFFNELSDCNDSYQLLYYVRRDGKDEIEIRDPRKRFRLSRVHYPTLKLDSIVIGSKITIYSRQYKVGGFEDEFTRKSLSRTKQKAFGIITPRGFASGAIGRMWASVEAAGLQIPSARLVCLSEGEADGIAELCDGGAPVPGGGGIEPFLPCLVFVVHGEDAFEKWGSLRSHLNTTGGGGAAAAASLSSGGGDCLGASARAGTEGDEGLRVSFFGAGEKSQASSSSSSASPANTASGSSSASRTLSSSSAAASLNGSIPPRVRGSSFPSAAASTRGGASNSSSSMAATASSPGEETCVVILPSAVAAGLAGRIMEDLLSRSHTSGLSLFRLGVYDLDRRCSEEFLEVYKHVIHDFTEFAAELCSGSCIFLAFQGADAVDSMRDIVGPRAVEVAQRVRPQSLRAKYGTGTGKPGLSIHCTDLKEDGSLEVDYFALLGQ